MRILNYEDPARYVGSKVTLYNARFGLSELEDDTLSGLIVVKKEKTSFTLPLKKSHFDLTMKTPSYQKIKTSEATNFNMENLVAEKALQKLVSFSQAISIHVILVSDSYLHLLTTCLFQVSAHVS